MLSEVKKLLPVDIAICAAAVSDFKPKFTSKSKIKKNDIGSVKLKNNVDILNFLGKNNKLRPKIVVGFSAETNNLIKKFKPEVLYVENVFYGKNVQSAIKLGQAKSSVMLAAEHNNIVSKEFSPREIKQSIVGNGSASKEQVAFMVKKIFKLDDKVLKKNDISDAIAVAWCGINRT